MSQIYGFLLVLAGFVVIFIFNAIFGFLGDIPTIIFSLAVIGYMLYILYKTTLTKKGQ